MWLLCVCGLRVEGGGLACHLGFVVLVCSWQRLLADRHLLPFPSLSLNESRGGGGVTSERRMSTSPFLRVGCNKVRRGPHLAPATTADPRP